MTQKAPPSDKQELTPLDAAEERALTEALRAAWSPAALDPALNERLIELALEDPLAPPSREEVVESERLRRALDGEGEHPGTELFSLLRAANRPKELEPGAAERLASTALVGRRRSGNVIFVAFGAAASAALAAAAAVMLFVFPAARSDAPSASSVMPAPPELVQSRTTAALFSVKFEAGETSERVDRIASSRARELRENRYAQWGVR
jgi:hypothetical protein